VTVGLNPSRREFENDPTPRFPGMERLPLEQGSEEFYKLYRGVLDNYFRENPYASWFDTFRGLLEGMDCGYYEGSANIALHTDLCSPIATDPTWNGLSKDQQQHLQCGGVELWHRLMEYLRPHAILISVAKPHLPNIRFPVLQQRRVVYTVRRENPYQVSQCRLQVGDQSTEVISGRGAQQPFGLVSYLDKLKIGTALSEPLFSARTTLGPQ
jgi:hypothetical protein